MERKTIASFGILIVLLASLVGTAGAQSGTTTDPGSSVTPTAVAGAKFFTHPVVKLLSAYFDQETEETATATEPSEVSESPEASESPSPEASETAEPSPSGLGPIGEEIATYHEQGMGFGVLVKLYSMAKASEEACQAKAATTGETPTTVSAGEGTSTSDVTPTPEPCTPVTIEELATAFKGGTGMGNLFKQYGKPALLGVGHVRKALKAQAESTPEPPSASDTEDTHGNGKGKGPHKPKQ